MAGRRGVPPHAPLEFAPVVLQPLIRHDGVTDRRRWESALFLKVRDEIQTGNLAIDGAKNFGRFEAFGPGARPATLAMIKRRPAAAGLPPSTCCHTFRATGITAYLSNGATLEHAQQIVGHASPKTTKLYDRTAGYGDSRRDPGRTPGPRLGAGSTSTRPGEYRWPAADSSISSVAPGFPETPVWCKLTLVDHIRNPYAPSAGRPPRELAGRDDLLHTFQVVLDRCRHGRPNNSIVMVGLRGVGKTVLLQHTYQRAKAADLSTVYVESPDVQSLPAILAPALRQTLLAMSKNERAKAAAKRGLQALAGFVGAFKIAYGDLEVRLDVAPEAGLADNGNLDQDLTTLLLQVGTTASAADTAVCLFVDELQYVEEDELSALITALHRASQEQSPIVLIGAGLPQLRGRMGEAKSYAERLVEFREVGPLSSEAARQAIEKPALAEDVTFTQEALQRIIDTTECYPYFLQVWGSHAWDVADSSPIDLEDVERATGIATAALDESFFRVRFDRLIESERRYLRAMAELGAGPHRSGDIASVLRQSVKSLGPRRSRLISKGMVWSPQHGETAFTVPLFHQFMKRIMGNDWRKC